MRKSTKLYILLGILLVICLAAFAVSQYEEKQEQIKNSGEVILEIPIDEVTTLSWENESGSYSFTKDVIWKYDEDSAFPVDEEKMENMLAQFESLAAAFTIEDVEDYDQYGLTEPVCTITIGTAEKSYTIKLGDFSKMDEERYISIGDGQAYLVEHDPLEEYDAVLRDMIQDDTVPEFDTVDQIEFTGSEEYTLVRDENGKSICADDLYYSDGNPLDTENVEAYADSLKSVSLSEYVSYNVTEEELKTYGMDEPDLTANLSYSVTDDEGNTEDSGSFSLSISRNPEEVKAYEEAVLNDEEDLPEITYYARLNDSQIVYKITETEYDAIKDASYDTLRHQKLFTADFSTVTSIEAEFNGETYTFTYNPPEDEETEIGSWSYGDKTIEIYDLRSAIRALSADSFTEEKAEGKEEISLTVFLDNEDFPKVELTLYQYDGTNCLAYVDGSPVAFVSRSETVDLTEAINEIILGN